MRILLVAYDNAMIINYFPLGLAYIAATLLKEGYKVEIYNQDISHYPEEHLTECLNKKKYDLIGVSVIGGYYQYRKLLKISDAINKSNNRPFYVIGGHGPSPDPEFFIKKTKADVVAIGEGETTVIELIKTLLSKKPLSLVKGIAFKDGDKVIVNERQPLIKDVDSIPFPAYHLFSMEYYRLRMPPWVKKTDFVMHVLSARGCTFECNFCYRLDKGSRIRSNESVIEELKLLKKDYRITHISFMDELLMVSVKRTLSLCEAIIKADLKITWNCNGRLNFAKPEVLNLMKQAGCTHINYGIESMDDEVLKNMKKGLTVSQIIKGVEATIKSGIAQGLNVIFGNIGDSKETLNKGVDFLLKYDDGAELRTIRPVTPYPGSPLYYYAIEKGLLKDCEDFYENKHVNSDLLTVNFTDLDDEEFHLSLCEANKKLLANYYQKKLANSIDECKKLYIERDTSFRGFRQV
jgi:radical SAM superfamily enzyme YgiQ (UPF0313 family)